jgi:hypothetical protein
MIGKGIEEEREKLRANDESTDINYKMMCAKISQGHKPSHYQRRKEVVLKPK